MNDQPNIKQLPQENDKYKVNNVFSNRTVRKDMIKYTWFR